MRQTIVNILNNAVYAPSGDNHQPWRFEVVDNCVNVFNLPERDTIMYNFKQHGSYIAHGCLLETIMLLANLENLQVNVEMFPRMESNQTLKLCFSEAGNNFLKNDLGIYVKQRFTNRRKYLPDKISISTLEDFEKIPAEIGSGEIKFITDKNQQAELGKLVAINERVLLESKVLHNSFFKQIVWTKDLENKMKQGLYFKTLELHGPPALMFRVFKHWKVLNFLNKLNISKLVESQNASVWASGGAHAALVFNSDTLEDFVNTGRMVQRLWLKATKHNLYLHPLNGVVYLARRIIAGNIEDLSAEHRELILKGYEKINQIFGINNQYILMLVRIGNAKKPSAVSSRMEPEIKILN